MVIVGVKKWEIEMPVFESTSTDIYEADPVDSPFGLPTIVNRHGMIEDKSTLDPIFNYLMFLFQSEVFLGQFRPGRTTRTTFNRWTTVRVTPLRSRVRTVRNVDRSVDSDRMRLLNSQSNTTMERTPESDESFLGTGTDEWPTEAFDLGS
jgi:hypothetical protein